eukprot:TRINITY_DN999_c0_g1_i1.p1 TRINITY_DN999_c0_g1~~TRINITY_DN999_c0_g1_i1.p1  ORF type:complete len:830 (-),score=272.39 TRINITY_DN999_c0_g1_i1:33-2216(-)
MEKAAFRSFYFNPTQTLWGNAHAEKDKEIFQTLNPGEYSYSFEYTLPEDIPFSMVESEHCCVRYRVKGSLVAPKKEDSVVVDHDFLVTNRNNYFDITKIKVNTRTDAKKSGLTLMATADSVHTLGDLCIVHVRVRKSETKDFKLKNLTCKLYEHRTRKTSENTVEYTTLLGEGALNMKTKGAEQFSEKVFTIPISSLILHDSFTTLKHFTITHWIDVELTIKWRPNLKVKLPIVIHPSRSVPSPGILEPVVNRLIAHLIEETTPFVSRSGKSVIDALAMIAKRYPTAISNFIVKTIGERLTQIKDTTVRIKLLSILEKCTEVCSSDFPDNVDTANWSVYKKLGNTQDPFMGIATQREQSMAPLPGDDDESENFATDFTSADPLTTNLISILRNWASLSIAWKDGPYAELAKKGIDMSAPAEKFNPKSEDDQSVPSQVSKLNDVPQHVKSYLIQLDQDLDFYQWLDNDFDYPAPVSEIAERLAINIYHGRRQIEDLISKYSKEKDFERLLGLLEKMQKIVHPIADSIQKAMDMIVSDPSTEDPIHLAVKAKVPLDGLYAAGFGIPVKRMVNAAASAGVPTSEKVVGLMDLTVNGSARNCFVMGTKNIYFADADGKTGTISYSDLKMSDVTTSMESGSGTVNVHVGGVKVSSKNIELEPVIVPLFQAFNGGSPAPNRKSQSKSNVRASSSDGESSEEETLQKKPPKEEPTAAPAEPAKDAAPLIDFGDL